MCMEDIRLGRELSGLTRSVVLPAATVTAIAAQNVRRTRLVVSNAGATVVFIGPQTNPPTATSGIALTAGAPVLVLRVEDWGNMLYQSWSAIDPAAGQIVTVTEMQLGRE